MKLPRRLAALALLPTLLGNAQGADRLAWSASPPGGRSPSSVPQFVAITFDDNFGLEDEGATGGVRAVLDYYGHHRNPPGEGNPDNFDASPLRTTLFDTTIYMAPPQTRVPGGARGEDTSGGNLAAWRAAVAAGEEIDDHTVHHFDGGVVPVGIGPCCRARHWTVAQWTAEIGAARAMLVAPGTGIGVAASAITGFRAPYLAYTDTMFTALQRLGFAYDSSLLTCVAAEGGCGWPYTLDAGSPDAVTLAQRFTRPRGRAPRRFPVVSPHPGLWEVPPSMLVVPPDAAAARYGFVAGLRARIAARAPMPYPSLYDPGSGQIAGLDYTLLIDAGVSGDELRAILEYNLDHHLAGNRAPLVLVAHSHLYAVSSRDENPDTPSEAVRQARWRGLTDFLDYALGQAAIRVVSTGQIVDWMRRSAAR